ncbi:MAG: hypothetical protein WCH31_09750 [Actinomycetes bacterium]
MTPIVRKRLLIAGLVAMFAAAFMALGAISKPTPVTTPTVAPATVAQTAPFDPWYWAVAVGPSDPNVVVLGMSSGLTRSADGGKTWKPAGLKGINTTSIVDLGSSMVAAGAKAKSVTGAVARKGTGRTVADGAPVVAISADDGKTWREVHPTGLIATAIQALAVDPANPASLYLLLNTGALYRSTDTAASFQLVSKKLGVAPWAFAYTDGGRVVAGDMDSGPFTSVDGTTWSKTGFKDSRGGKMVMEYAVKPDDAKTVLMTSIGVVRSTDGGLTWRLVLQSTTMFGPVAYSPSKPEIAYAVGFDRSVWRSADGGQSWTNVR